MCVRTRLPNKQSPSILFVCCCLLFWAMEMAGTNCLALLMIHHNDDDISNKLIAIGGDNEHEAIRLGISNQLSVNNSSTTSNDDWPFSRRVPLTKSDTNRNNMFQTIGTPNQSAAPFEFQRIKSSHSENVHNSTRQTSSGSNIYQALLINLGPAVRNSTSGQKLVQIRHNTSSTLTDKRKALLLQLNSYQNGSKNDNNNEINPTRSSKNSRSINNNDKPLVLIGKESVFTAESNQIEHNSNCALILKRTYILKNRDEWGERFVFNDGDPDDEKKKIHKTDLCIKYSDVDKAIEEARHRIKFEKPDDLDSLEVSEPSIAAVAELNLATGLLLTKRFDLSHDEILNALPMIDMSSTKFFWKDLCPKHVRPMSCTKSRYRTITAHCNNLRHPSWGAAKTPYSRYLPPDYADGLSAPRAGQDGKPLPSARLITSLVHVDSDEPSHDYSILFADWGQLLNHDVTRVAVGEGKYQMKS